MLEFNGTIIVLAISFVIFVILENFIFYRPLKKVMDDRSNYIKQNEISAGESYSAADTLGKEKNEKIARAKEKSSEIINNTTSAAQAEFDSAIKEHKLNSNKAVEETKRLLEQEKISVHNELKKQIGAYASDIISKILKKDVSVVNVNDEILEKALRGEL